MKHSVWLLMAALSCAGTTPTTRYYRLVATNPTLATALADRLVIVPAEIDALYDDGRIVYQTSRYRVDFYHYHRWASDVRLQLTNYLQQAYTRSGLFEQVLVEDPLNDTVVLRAHLRALEEIDMPELWFARVHLRLQLSTADPRTVLWSADYRRREPVRERTPEGVVSALSIALDEIVTDSAAPIARHLAAWQAQRDRSNIARRHREDTGSR